MAVQGVVIKAHLRVNRLPLAVFREDERVDLDQRRVFLDIGVIQCRRDLREPVDLGRWQPEREGNFPGLVGVKPEPGIGLPFHDLVRPIAGNFLDIHATFGAGHHQHLPVGAVKHNAKVQLPGYLRALGHQHLVHRVTVDVHAQDCAGRGPRLLRRMRELDATGLSPAPCMHLGLHHHRAAQLGGNRRRVVRGVRHLAGIHWNPIPGQDLSRLILMDIHRRTCSFCLSQGCSSRRRARIPVMIPAAALR